MSHNHSHGGEVAGGRMELAVTLTLAFVGLELVAGLLSRSLALVSDAGHNFTDALALILSWYAFRVAQRPSDGRKTFGYHRVSILVALANAASLVVIALLILGEGIQRLRHPEPVAGGLMVAVALVAVFLNASISIWLRRGAKSDLNLRSAYLHIMGDALSGVGVVSAGVVVKVTGSGIADPIVSLLIAGLILLSSKGILKEALDILMEAVPEGIHPQEVERSILGVAGVDSIHNLHVWAVASGITACSCHVVIAPNAAAESREVLRQVVDVVKSRFGFTHATIQIEAGELAACDHEGPTHRHEHDAIPTAHP